jgi:uncharacterized protein
MTSFLLTSLAGGALIGVGAAVLLLFIGRTAGVSGIAGGLLPPTRGDALWRLAFVLGLIGGGVVLRLTLPGAFSASPLQPPVAVVAAGLLLGFGSRLAGGCTSGHGVCGVSRLSARSLVATVTFIGFGALAVLSTRFMAGS